MEVIEDVQSHTFGQNWKFKTKKLVLEGIGFECEKLLPRLISRMPELGHVLLQVNSALGYPENVFKNTNEQFLTNLL